MEIGQRNCGCKLSGYEKIVTKQGQREVERFENN